jgi:multicomponent Na+:H+ antiporter subunit D
LQIVAVAAIFYGSVAAIYQTNVKKMLAYSSIANVGYIILGLAMLNEAGLTSSIFQLVAHGIAKTGAFLEIGCFVLAVGGVEFKDLAGLGKKMPFTTLLFLIFGLSLIGVPLTAGFIGKWYLLSATISAPILLIAVLLSSVLAVVYIWRVVEAAYFGTTKVKLADPDSYSLVPLWTLAAAVIYFGVHPSGLLRLASSVAGDLLL